MKWVMNNPLVPNKPAFVDSLYCPINSQPSWLLHRFGHCLTMAKHPPKRRTFVATAVQAAHQLVAHVPKASWVSPLRGGKKNVYGKHALLSKIRYPLVI